MIRLSIIIVNWNTKDLLKGCLESIYQNPLQGKFEIIVVNNGSNDESPNMVAKGFPQVKLVENKENVGFARANNQAIELAQGEYILLLNPDTRVEPGSLQQMIDFLSSHSEAGAVGAKLLLPDGRVQQDPFGRFPSLKNVLLMKLWQVTQRIRGNKELTRKDFSDTLEADWVSGASMMIRQEVVSKVGVLDENYFLYLEDVDWCYRIRQAGWKIYVLPQAVITHYLGQSRQINLEKARAEYRKSFNYFCRKYGRRILLALSKVLK